MDDSGSFGGGLIVGVLLMISLHSCGVIYQDNNAKPTYGKESGLPKNCRAIIQANVAGWRSHAYTPAEVIESIDRNCGAHGYSWGD